MDLPHRPSAGPACDVTPEIPVATVSRGAVVPVSLLVGSARLLLERQLGLLWVAGEISNFTRAASGHCYFNLKDSNAQVRCVFFRYKAQFANFPLKDGLSVEVRATPSIFVADYFNPLNPFTLVENRFGQASRCTVYCSCFCSQCH